MRQGISAEYVRFTNRATEYADKIVRSFLLWEAAIDCCELLLAENRDYCVYNAGF